MKNKIVISIAAAILSYAGASYADFTFTTTNKAACPNIAGRWSGDGKVSNWLIGTCKYKGGGTLNSLDASGNFSLNTTVNRESGNGLFCPPRVSITLNGSCVDRKNQNPNSVRYFEWKCCR